MTAVRHAARAFSRSVILSLRHDRFQASRLDTSGPLSEVTLIRQTTAVGSAAAMTAVNGNVVTTKARDRDTRQLRTGEVEVRGGYSQPAPDRPALESRGPAGGRRVLHG